MFVYRIQPQGAELHGIETTTSNDELAGGVHVFESLPEVYFCREWLEQSKVELITIECQKTDLSPNGDYEGVTLRKGCGTVVCKKKFRSTRAVSDWVNKEVKRKNK